MSPIFPAPPTASHARPSLFELLAQDQLRDLLHPVVRYILTYFTHRHPRYLLRILHHHEEFFACLLLLLERHHLKRHNASLSEHFYQLRSVPERTIPTPRLSQYKPPRRDLSRRQRWGLLVFLVGIPYLRARLQDHYQTLQSHTSAHEQNPEDRPPDHNQLTTPQRLFLRIYPLANLALDITFLSYDLAYLFNHTQHYRPWHALLRLRIERRDPDDAPAPSSLFDRLPPLLPPLLLALKLSQWWFSPSSPRAGRSTAPGGTKSYHSAIIPPRPLPLIQSDHLPLTPPPSPPLDPSSSSGEEKQSGEKQGYRVTERSYGTCPLCGSKWQNPAVLPSGWVVCWRCGWDALEVDEQEGGGDGGLEKDDDDPAGRCPMTGVPVRRSELRKILL